MTIPEGTIVDPGQPVSPMQQVLAKLAQLNPVEAGKAVALGAMLVDSHAELSANLLDVSDTNDAKPVLETIVTAAETVAEGG